MPRSTSARRGANRAERNGNEPQTPPPVSACDTANAETRPVTLELPSTTCNSPASLSLLSTPSLIEESFDVLPLQQDDVAISDMIAYLIDQNLMQPAISPSSTFPASPVSPSGLALSSDSSGLNTPINGNVAELFNIEAGCGTSLSGNEYLSHAELEALLDGSLVEDLNSNSSAPALKLCDLTPKDLEGLFNYPLVDGDFTSLVDDSNTWDINQATSLTPMFTNIFDSQRMEPIVF